ncbi:WxL domain-containing protein [Lacticaseibacillus baoqingensis]|uniref:WxL domain-containing protein n=1 Tax=Lacticaseibacillus baoqingensis TaxID=2486013 RepID=A0ABW4E5A6_9LACO|nr:WxL domain-containing protein [Lacticaseibacillus baoqingensis]
MKLTTLLFTAALLLGSTAVAATPVKAAETEAVVTVQDPGDAGQLTLQSAPEFNFGTVKAVEIYNGFDKDQLTTNKDLVIVDGRPANLQGGWTLTTSLAPFSKADDAKQTLAQSTLQLTGKNTVLALDELLTSDAATPGALAYDGQRGTLTLPAAAISAHLTQAATPNASVSDGDHYVAKLTWTLTPAVAASALGN